MRIRITWQIKTRICWYTKFRDRFETMYGKLPSHRAKKKLKSIWYYLVNDNEWEAWKCYQQLDKELQDLAVNEGWS